MIRLFYQMSYYKTMTIHEKINEKFIEFRYRANTNKIELDLNKDWNKLSKSNRCQPNKYIEFIK